MANVKIVGYAKKTFYNSGIEFRNFSDSLVGNQFTDGGGDVLFTTANFTITTNFQPKASKIFNTNAFSGYYSLSDLGTTSEQSQLILPSTTVLKLNLDNHYECINKVLKTLLIHSIFYFFF